MAASISERSKVTNNCRRAVGTGDVEVPKALVSMLLVLQIPFRLLLAKSYSLCITLIDNFIFSETFQIIVERSYVIWYVIGGTLCLLQYELKEGLRELIRAGYAEIVAEVKENVLIQPTARSVEKDRANEIVLDARALDEIVN